MALFAASLTVAVFVHVIVGTVLAVIVGYFGYRVVRFLIKQLRSRVAVEDDGYRFNVYGEEEFFFPWDTITFAGIATETNGRKGLYIYVEEDDKFLLAGDEFAPFAELVASFERHRHLDEMRLGLGETVRDRLRGLLGLDENPTREPD